MVKEGKLSVFWKKKLVALVGVVALGWGGGMAESQAQSDSLAETPVQFLQIGTGTTGGAYFPMGGLIASAISNPPGSRPCDRGGSCGVPGLIAVAKSTNGSVDNLRAIADGSLQMALSQADVAYWAYHGQGVFEDHGVMRDLRAIAMLYQEYFHLVVRADAGIASVEDLRGKRVSLGDEGSGTLTDTLSILAAYELTDADVEIYTLRPGPAADALVNNEIDAFFFIAGAPIPIVSSLTDAGIATLVPINGPQAVQLAETYPFLLQRDIPEGTYNGIGAIPTLSVGATLVASARLPDDLVYGITRALWHPANRPLFERGHPGGAQMDPERALRGLGIPLHGGAANYYFDAGIMELR